MHRDRRHAGEALHELVHEALEIRGQVLNDDEGHVGIDGHGAKESLQGLQPPRRGANANHMGWQLARERRLVEVATACRRGRKRWR